MGLSLMAIGALSLVSQAYVFKFLWSPCLDRYSFFPFAGLRRSWLIACQAMIALGLVAMALCPLPQHYGWLVGLAVMVAFFSATFDTAFDAFRIEYLSKQDYGLGNAVYVTAYRTAMLVSGGLAMVAAAYYGWRVVYIAMAVFAALAAMVSMFVPDRVKEKQTATNWSWTKTKKMLPSSWEWLFIAVAAVFYKVHVVLSLTLILAFILRKWGWQYAQNMRQAIPHLMWILLFVFLYKFGEAFGTALSTSFLLRIGHYSLVQIGFAYKSCALLATIAGSFLGGYLYRSFRLNTLLLSFGLLQAACLVWYIPIAMGHHSLWLMITAVSSEAGTAGMATAAFVSFLMRLCQHQHVASQFALFSALASAGRVVTGPMAAWVIDQVGWVHYYQWAMVICLPALAVLLKLWRHPVFTNEPQNKSMT